MADQDRTTQPFGALIEQGHGKLVIVAGKCPEGLTYSLSGESHEAGRSSNEISLAEDELVSPRHARFSYKGGVLHVADLGSTNGTYLRLRGPHTLRHGDWFRVGDQLFRFELLETQDEYRTADGTLHFTSPPRKGAFRVVQMLEGGKEGLTSSSSTDELTIGGEGASVVFTADPHLSRQHARIARGEDGFVLEDLGSLNGTYVRLGAEQPLSHGDYLFIGQELLRVELT